MRTTKINIPIAIIIQKKLDVEKEFTCTLKTPLYSGTPAVG
jgi:hypothetical protein